MKKTYALLKPLILALALIITTSLILNSCKKDNSEASDSKLTTLKQWYQNNITLKSNSDFKDLEPIWQTAYINNQEKYTVYEINLSKPDALVLPFSTKNIKAEATRVNLRLLIFEDKVSQKIKFASYMYIENDNKQDFGKLHYRSLEKLTGKVFFYHQSGKMANGWIYQDGKVVSLTSPTTEKQYLLMSQSKRAGLAGEKLMNAGDQECNTGRVETFFWGCVTAGPTKTCGWHSKGTSYMTICRAITASGDETTIDYIAPPDYGGYWPDNVDYFGDLNGTAIMTEECGCIEGNTGKVSCAEKDIIDSLKGYPCAQDLLRQMKTLKSDVANLIKNTFAKNDLVNVTYNVNKYLAGTKTDGEEGDGNHTSVTGEFYVSLNPDVLSKSTKEYILVVMYHEALHAFFSRRLQQLGEVEFKKQYEGVSVNGGRSLGVKDDDHLPMSYQNYINGLKDVIMKFNPNFNEDRAWALAKGGIIQLLPEELKINEQERDATKTGYTGTKCP